jgi:3,4-dihydroxy 2-butanone 4-phosphate synthase/GTP cyclohydrolase II
VIPTIYGGEFRFIAYENDVDNLTHIALIKGEIDSAKPILVRVHSECMTGDIFGSQRCDCGDQLHKAMEMIDREGCGVILYLRQEGRGIGLVNKLKAYELQRTCGLDTLEANRKLGFAGDLRDYGLGAQILSHLGVRKMRLLTNNPKKMVGLEGYGLSIVEQIPIEVQPNEHNRCYLECKKLKMGHLLRKVEEPKQDTA